MFLSCKWEMSDTKNYIYYEMLKAESIDSVRHKLEIISLCENHQRALL
jgi:hypothetical protein